MRKAPKEPDEVATTLQSVGGRVLVRDGGHFIGVQPSARPVAERNVVIDVVTAPDGARLGDLLGDLLSRTASGELPVRVAAVVPLHG